MGLRFGQNTSTLRKSDLIEGPEMKTLKLLPFPAGILKRLGRPAQKRTSLRISRLSRCLPWIILALV
jgi:hypothetical protein